MRARRDSEVRVRSVLGWRVMPVLLVVVPALASCDSSPAPDTSGAPLPPSAPVVDVILDEYRFELAPSLPVGRVVFRFANQGTESHRPALLPLDDDFPPIQEEVRNTEPRLLLPFAGVDTREPGSSGTFAVDLVPGQRYALICFMTTPGGEGHANKGMTWETRVGGASTAPITTRPTAPGTTTAPGATTSTGG